MLAARHQRHGAGLGLGLGLDTLRWVRRFLGEGGNVLFCFALHVEDSV